MIKIRASSSDLADQVAEQLPTWKRLASDRTRENITAGHYIKHSNEIWSQLKDILKSAQFYKCAYCESGLGKRGVRWQVEHYRPKSGVDIWQPSSADFSDFTDQPWIGTGGYYLLAYDIANYLASCESCNNRKRNYFPVRAARQPTATDSSVLASEQPLIINPINAQDTDPEELICFDGPIPQPVKPTDPARLRAVATIEILDLTREDLVIQRCELIVKIWLSFQDQNAPGQHGEIARKMLSRLTDDHGPHRNCGRSFLQLCTSDPGRAAAFAELATKLT